MFGADVSIHTTPSTLQEVVQAEKQPFWPSVVVALVLALTLQVA